MIEAFFTNPFLQIALLAGISASVAGGVIGSYVVVKRILFISGSIAHSVLGGMGICLYLKRTYDIEALRPIHGAFVAAIIAAFLIGWIHLKYREREDTVIAALWALGMSLGVIFISLTPGYNVEIVNFLFGNILWASRADIATLIILDGLLLLTVAILHRRFMAICFDEDQAKLQKVPVKSLYFLLLTLIAITVVLLIQVVGAILVIAILSLPPAIANSFTQKLSQMMIYAVLIGALITIFGFFLSFALNWPPGSTIAFTATLLYFINLFFFHKS